MLFDVGSHVLGLVHLQVVEVDHQLLIPVSLPDRLQELEELLLVHRLLEELVVRDAVFLRDHSQEGNRGDVEDVLVVLDVLVLRHESQLGQSHPGEHALVEPHDLHVVVDTLLQLVAAEPDLPVDLCLRSRRYRLDLPDLLSLNSRLFVDRSKRGRRNLQVFELPPKASTPLFQREAALTPNNSRRRHMALELRCEPGFTLAFQDGLRLLLPCFHMRHGAF